MILPGPEAQQLAIYIGWKLHGKKGGLAAGALFVLPSMFVILALSMVYVHFGRLPLVAAMISGLRPGIVALVILALLRVARRTLVARVQWLAAVCGFAAMALFRVSIPLVILSIALLGVIVGWRRPELLAVTPGKGSPIRDRSGRPWKQFVTSNCRSRICCVAPAFGIHVRPLSRLRFLEAANSFLYANRLRHDRRFLHCHPVCRTYGGDEVSLAKFVPDGRWVLASRDHSRAPYHRGGVRWFYRGFQPLPRISDDGNPGANRHNVLYVFAMLPVCLHRCAIR